MVKDIRDYINTEQFEQKERKYASAGGHTTDIIQNAFNGEMLDFYSSGGYQGECCSAWKLEDDFYAVISSYFGSCTVCDQFLGIHNKKEAEDALRSLAHSARKFESLESMRKWINNATDEAENYAYKSASNLKV